MEKYVSINTRNIFNYLTNINIIYIYNKIRLNLIHSINICKKCWLIKSKNVLIIIFDKNEDNNICIFININNLNDIKIYKYENYIYMYKSILNNIISVYNNSYLRIYYPNRKYVYNDYYINYTKIPKKNKFNNRLYYITYKMKNNIKNKIKIENEYKNIENLFYYHNSVVLIYIKIRKPEGLYSLYFRQNNAIRKIKLILI